LTCQHLKETTEPAPLTPYSAGCPQCLAVGNHNWVHLRLCMSCGLVACCDSSPARHMSAHHAAEGHPVMRSFEPGEGWRWCYEDEQLG
jgi:hypothetical protein